MKRSRSYLRKQRARVIRRKVRIVKEQGNYWNYTFAGRLSKGKIHCSCRMCRKKTYDLMGVRDERALFRQLSMLQDLDTATAHDISRTRSYIRRKKT